VATPPDSQNPWTPGASQWAVEHAQDLTLFRPSGPPGRAEVVLLTDPWSVWCWGFEPVRRALEHRYPTIQFSALVGGMFPTMPDPAALGFNVERFFAIVQRSTGMPIAYDATRYDRPTSTYPACIHYYTMRLVRPELADSYLRRLREAVYLDRRNVSRPQVAADVAVAMGVPREEFEEALASGEPEREFEANLTRLESNNLHAYPTFLVRSGPRLARVEGFQSLPALLSLVEQVTGRAHATAPPPPLLDLFRDGERLATREVAEVLDLSLEAAAEELQGAARDGSLTRERHPTGDVWRKA